MNSRTWPSSNTCPIGMQHNARTSKPGELTMAKKLEKSMWRPYFDDISKVLAGKRAEIEVAALNLGDQIEVERRHRAEPMRSSHLHCQLPRRPGRATGISHAAGRRCGRTTTGWPSAGSPRARWQRSKPGRQRSEWTASRRARTGWRTWSDGRAAAE